MIPPFIFVKMLTLCFHINTKIKGRGHRGNRRFPLKGRGHRGNRRFPLKGRYKQSKKRKPTVSFKIEIYFPIKTKAYNIIKW
jgi:hypothetical protein